LGTNTRGVSAFLVIAFGVAWLLWEIPLRLGVPAGSGLFGLLVVPGTFAPALATFVVRQWVTREGFADAGLEAHVSNWPYYLAAWAVPLGTVGFVILAAPGLGLGHADLGPVHGTPFPVVVGLSSVYALVATPILWGEEFGWRGYLQLRLFPQRPLLAAMATGLLWGVWHYPLLATGIELPKHPYLIFLIFPVLTVLYSIIFGWLRLRSGSIWVSSFAHSAVNNLGSSSLVVLFAAQPDRLGVALLGLVPLLVMSLMIALFGGLRAPSSS
jgi:membrane protease YdiL (CAAX protease family)